MRTEYLVVKNYTEKSHNLKVSVVFCFKGGYMIKYFESIEKAKEFAKENHITKYVFQTPEFMERGVDMVWESDYGNAD